MRYITKDAFEAATGETLPVAKYLDIILYSKEQLIEEAANIGNPAPTYSQEWAVISVKPQVCSSQLVPVLEYRSNWRDLTWTTL